MVDPYVHTEQSMPVAEAKPPLRSAELFLNSSLVGEQKQPETRTGRRPPSLTRKGLRRKGGREGGRAKRSAEEA